MACREELHALISLLLSKPSVTTEAPGLLSGQIDNLHQMHMPRCVRHLSQHMVQHHIKSSSVDCSMLNWAQGWQNMQSHVRQHHFADEIICISASASTCLWSQLVLSSYRADNNRSEQKHLQTTASHHAQNQHKEAMPTAWSAITISAIIWCGSCIIIHVNLPRLWYYSHDRCFETQKILKHGALCILRMVA